jgi:hypothetical protein
MHILRWVTISFALVGAFIETTELAAQVTAPAATGPQVIPEASARSLEVSPTHYKLTNFPLEEDPSNLESLRAHGAALAEFAPDILPTDLATKSPLNAYLSSVRQAESGNLITVRFNSSSHIICLTDSERALSSIPDDATIAVVAIHPPDAAKTICRDFSQTPDIQASKSAQMLVKMKDDTWVRALTTTTDGDGVLVNAALLQDKDHKYRLNGQLLSNANGRHTHDESGAGFLFGSNAISTYRLEVIPPHRGCRTDVRDTLSMDLILSEEPAYPERRVANGITVGAPKVYDTFTLRQMLSTTAAQLASISGFNQAQIFGQLGTFQGVTRDTSYLAAQATATPTPIVSATTSNGASSALTSSLNTVASNGGSSSVTTMQCPPGTVPSINTGAVQSCTVPLLTAGSAATSLAAGSIGSTPAQQTNTALSNNLQTTANAGSAANTSQQVGSTITSGGYAGTVPAVPTSSPLSAPSNVGVSAADSLVEQVQLNSQITNLRLLLQGALSDQYLIRNSHAVATRAQTTMGFAVTLNPLRQYKHSVAEVRVIVVSPPRVGEISIVNLLPAAKTYNVAKVTSHQSAFGAGVVVDTINVGANTGRSKDRLYLAKDTDTVALEYSGQKYKGLPRPFPQFASDISKEIARWMSLGECSDDVPKIGNQNVEVFGWQFRPVLGADYVQSGQRQVYAQLALPTTVNQAYAPFVFIQTRWRSYNENKQALGAVFTDSCTMTLAQDAISLLNPIQVDDVATSEVGGGVLKIHVTGKFFSPGISAVAGPNAIPVFTSDGRTLDMFISALTLMQSGPITLVQEDGSIVPLSLRADDVEHSDCNIQPAKLTAVPRPDGTAKVFVRFNYSKTYRSETDGSTMPAILIGNQVFGLQASPFLLHETNPHVCSKSTANVPVTCEFEFVASTDALRAAQTFVIRDLRWEDFSQSGDIDFEPAFSSIKSLLPDSKDPNSHPAPVYSITGFGFDSILNNCANKNCVQVYDGADALTTAKISFASPTTAVFTNPTALKTNALRVVWQSSNDSRAVEWDLALPKGAGTSVTSSPALLNVGDNRTVTFSGGEVLPIATGPATQSIAFDTGISLTAKFDPKTSTLKVLIPASVTQKPGYKEFTALMSVPAKADPQPVQLPIQVVQGATTTTN